MGISPHEHARICEGGGTGELCRLLAAFWCIPTKHPWAVPGRWAIPLLRAMPVSILSPYVYAFSSHRLCVLVRTCHGRKNVPTGGRHRGHGRKNVPTGGRHRGCCERQRDVQLRGRYINRTPPRIPRAYVMCRLETMSSLFLTPSLSATS